MMVDQPPRGNTAVYIFLEMIALGFVLTAVDSFVNGNPLTVWGGCFVGGFVFFLAGIYWPKISSVLGERLIEITEWLAGYGAVLVLGVALYIAIAHPEYRKNAIGFATACILVWCCIYVQTLRRDMDRYAMPRWLSTRQKRKMRATLIREQRHLITVHVDPNDTEARAYADHFYRFFLSIGWGSQINLAPPYPLHEGIYLITKGTNRRRESDPSSTIQRAFSRAGIFSSGSGEGAGEFSLILEVGRRPPVLLRPGLLYKVGRALVRMSKR
jgi:hypothetical protein